jgi:hypothetical protein
MKLGQQSSTIAIDPWRIIRVAAGSMLTIGLVPSMIMRDQKGSDHAIAPGEYLGKDRVGRR